jgi:DNA-directed RNA polymerase subunit RPC12/RpoP
MGAEADYPYGNESLHQVTAAPTTKSGKPPIPPSVAAGPLAPYFAARWLCIQCGKFLAGSRTPPKSTSKCPHCGKATLLETFCQGMTARRLPFADRPATNHFGKVERGYWQQQPVRHIHKKGYKRKAGAKDERRYIPLILADDE